jgi:DNA-binding NarL/FixJ family response regulator
VYCAAIQDCPSPEWGDCDLAIIDLGDQTQLGTKLLAELQRARPALPKLALVDGGDIPAAVQAIRAGATDCVEKTTDSERLLVEIKTLLARANSHHHPPQSPLTRAETAVLDLLLEGKTNQQVALALHRSPRTVEVHRSNIMRKLEVSGLVDLAKAAASMGLFRIGHGDSPPSRSEG